ncbi:MAG: PQQ-dependent sugar dehydrogenase, partial [Candidatus Eiseniibacteriota bacterium]
GLLYIADVGQDRWEEVNAVAADSAGLNFGWNILEGRHDLRVQGRSREGLVLPLVEYSHRDGCSITGGYVYRGRAVPELVGHYFFSDYCSGWIRSFRVSNGRATDLREWTGAKTSQVTSFGVDGNGELYVLSGSGEAYRFAPAK